VIIAYWNTERASGLESRNLGPQVRCLWCCQQLLQWVRDTYLAHQELPSLIFLTEVSQGGGPMSAYLDSVSGYRARYIPAGDRNNNPSPCSYIIMWRDTLNPEIKVIGASQKRPVLRVRVHGLTVGGVHIIANQLKAPDEIFGDIAELHMEQRPAVLIGDMNYAWEQLDKAQPGKRESFEDEIEELFDWTPVHPRLEATHGRHSRETGELRTQILDYLWKSEDVTRIEPMPPIPGYNQWTQIDHAPIAYRIHLNDEDEVMSEEEDARVGEAVVASIRARR
jgi:endonuclease/exonuclease/phosphatase family metal-dependent hydrolase